MEIYYVSSCVSDDERVSTSGTRGAARLRPLLFPPSNFEVQKRVTGDVKGRLPGTWTPHESHSLIPKRRSSDGICISFSCQSLLLLSVLLSNTISAHGLATSFFPATRCTTIRSRKTNGTPLALASLVPFPDSCRLQSRTTLSHLLLRLSIWTNIPSTSSFLSFRIEVPFAKDVSLCA